MVTSKKTLDLTTSLSKYLLAMQQGEEVVVPRRFFTDVKVRATVTRLNKKPNHLYTTQTRGFVDEIKVTRIQ